MMSTVARKSLSKKTPKQVSFGVFFFGPDCAYGMVLNGLRGALTTLEDRIQ